MLSLSLEAEPKSLTQVEVVTLLVRDDKVQYGENITYSTKSYR